MDNKEMEKEKKELDLEELDQTSGGLDTVSDELLKKMLNTPAEFQQELHSPDILI